MPGLIYDKTCSASKFLNALISKLGIEHWATQSTLNYQVNINKVCSGQPGSKAFNLEILHLSDIHIESIPDHGASLIRQLESLTFDLVVLTGDYKLNRCASNKNTLKLLAPLLNSLRCEHGIVAVQGNHDTPEFMNQLVKHDVTVLDNRSTFIKVNGQRINIVGISDPHYWQKDDLPKAMSHCAKQCPTILLAHSAERSALAQHFPIDLYLCGHSHGGQICLPWGKPIINNSRCQRRFINGAWFREFYQGYTSRGVGTTGFPLRIQCPPEIVIHTLFNNLAETP
ncbi:MAG: hypothetical protein COB04_05755 [Gammaproteobacteria bacterium]|nr:MAG: hypothetical protein COB04_17855 [Gammaproteobacteria bacterium]PCJ19398.1 MAG: hypothetical protein COB04_05755 [Gammaproteobacteria bacterium]